MNDVTRAMLRTALMSIRSAADHALMMLAAEEQSGPMVPDPKEAERAKKVFGDTTNPKE